MKNKAKLAFEMLEMEMEIISCFDQKIILGGNGPGIGRISSGDGSVANPYVITSTFYYSSSASSSMQNGINSMISEFNNSGTTSVDGKNYTFSFGSVSVAAGQDVATVMNDDIRNSDYTISGAPIVTGSLPLGTIGEARPFSIVIDTDQIFDPWQVKTTILHEVGHKLGYDGGFDSQGHSSTGVMAPQDDGLHSEHITYEELQNIIRNGVLPDSTGSYDTSYMVLSTGVDDIGYFQIKSTTNSSGHSMTFIEHPYYGQENDFTGVDNWSAMTGLLSSGYDDFGSYYNYAFIDEYGNTSTGYYHPIMHSSGDSTGGDSTGGDSTGG